MGTNKIRIKIGEHEFEAAGDQETVQRELDRFYKVIDELRQQTPASPTRVQSEAKVSYESLAPVSSKAKIPYESKALQAQIPKNLSAIFSYQEGTLMLKARLPGQDREREAALVLLYGYRVIQDIKTVLSGNLLESMKISGYNISRVDRLLTRFVNDGVVLTSGIRRGTAYQLTPAGFQKAENISEELRSLLQ